MNKVFLIGRLATDPVTKVTQSGNGFTYYSLAVDEYRSGSDSHTNFIRIKCFGRGSEFADKYLKKGMKIAIEGHIHCSKYKANDGKDAYEFSVIAEQHEFCEKKQEATTNSEQGEKFLEVPDGLIEELPFN